MKRGDLVKTQSGDLAVIIKISSTKMFNADDRACRVLLSKDSTTTYQMASSLKRVNS